MTRTVDVSGESPVALTSSFGTLVSSVVLFSVEVVVSVVTVEPVSSVVEPFAVVSACTGNARHPTIAATSIHEVKLFIVLNVFSPIFFYFNTPVHIV